MHLKREKRQVERHNRTTIPKGSNTFRRDVILERRGQFFVVMESEKERTMERTPV